MKLVRFVFFHVSDQHRVQIFPIKHYKLFNFQKYEDQELFCLYRKHISDDLSLNMYYDGGLHLKSLS